ncbi:MAG: endonuclease/exonuclease/phosphatase family protein [Bacteroidales bacterium]|jgi:endonuclease/exonuclease/phosphatase family metal-dependent hydrolase|nr:endonuclease/exonuclease/phosphatase family protein [Bacteroidales bacterium]
MKTDILKAVFLSVLICTETSCKEKSGEASVQFDVSSNELVFWPEASSKTVSVSGSSAFTATLAEFSDPSWCTVEIIPDKTENLKISVTENAQVSVERSGRIMVSAEGVDSKIITVRQTAPDPSLSVKETAVTVNENVGFDFTLDVSANIPVAFDLPSWIKEKAGNTPVLGAKTYSFVADALSGVDQSREGVITVRSATAAFNNAVAIPVRQNRMNCLLRVATFNIRYKNTQDGENGWDYRKGIVNDLIRSYDFEIFGAQEALKSQIDDILAQGGYSYTGGGRDDGVNAGEHAAIFYKTERFELLGHGDFWFSETPDVPSIGWDGAVCCKRICSWGKFRDKVSGRDFYVFNSHFDYEGTTSRLESSKLLVAKIKEIAAGFPVFATGDFNSNTSMPGLQYILNDGLMKDSRAQSETPPAGTLATAQGFNPNTDMSSNNNRIDFIFVTGDIHIKSYTVINDRPNGKFPSDHEPVLVVAEF